MSCRKRSIALVLVAMTAPLSVSLAHGDEPSHRERVEASVHKAGDFLLQRQRDSVRIVTADGTRHDVTADWKDVRIDKAGCKVTVAGTEYRDVVRVLPPGWFEPEGALDGPGPLFVWALLDTGLNPMLDKRVALAIQSVLHTHSVRTVAGARSLEPGAMSTQAAGIRASALAAAVNFYRTGETNIDLRREIQAELKRLLNARLADGGWTSSLDPANRSAPWDMLSTEYALFGLLDGAAWGRIGTVLTDSTRPELITFLLAARSPDGGWGAGPGKPSDETSTAAACSRSRRRRLAAMG